MSTTTMTTKQTTCIRTYYNNIATLYLMCAYSNERPQLRLSFLLKPKGNKNNNFVFVKYRLVATWQTISFARSTGKQTPFPPSCARESLPMSYVRIILYTGIYNSITYSQQWYLYPFAVSTCAKKRITRENKKHNI